MLAITCKPTSALLTTSSSITQTLETPPSVYTTELLSRFCRLEDPMRSMLQLAELALRGGLLQTRRKSFNHDAWLRQ